MAALDGTTTVKVSKNGDPETVKPALPISRCATLARAWIWVAMSRMPSGPW
jgi:hypothetical protein